MALGLTVGCYGDRSAAVGGPVCFDDRVFRCAGVALREGYR
jgi:hypothetical protein